MYSPQSQPIQNAGLVKYLVPALVFLHVLVFSVCVTSQGFPAQSFAPLFLGCLVSCFSACLTILFAKSNVPKFIAFFLVCTFLLKLPICLITPETTYLSIIPLQGKQLAQIVCQKFLLFSLGFLGFALGAVFASRFFWSMADPRKREVQWSVPEKGFALLLIIFVALQAMRAILLIGMQIGAPGIVSRELLIPRLAGFLTILGTRGLLVVTTALLAWAISRRSYRALFIAMLAALSYVLVEIIGGWRSGLYYYSLCGLWIFLAAEPSKLKSRLKPFVFGFLVMALLLFVPVMDYRHNLMRGLSQLDAAKAVVQGRGGDERDFLEKVNRLVNRFNGLDLYVVASHASEGKNVGIWSLLNGSAGRRFTYEILGVPEEAVTTYGSTLWGIISIALGDQWLGFAGLMAGAVIGGLPVFCLKWFYSPAMRTVYECNVAILFVILVMGNGAFALYFKDLVVSFSMCLLIKVLATEEQTAAYYPINQLNYRSFQQNS